MGAKRRVRQTGKPAPSLAVHARHNQHDPRYTCQQFYAELAAEELEAAEREMAQRRKFQEREAA